ncbi:MAG: hypothetical protein Q9192_007976 [Flavoplaca navasiana]
MVSSALIGQPPLTDSDYWIVKGNQLLSGKSNLDPSKGLKIPPLRPPPDQYRLETRGPAITAVSAVIFVIMISVTMARFMLRKFMKELKFGLDDWLMVPALILASLWPILQICAVKYSGTGKHVYDVTYHELYMSKWAFIKLSITAFNMRLTGLSSRKWMYAHWSFFGILVVFILCTIFLAAFQCNPPMGAWNVMATGHLEKAPTCIPDNDISFPLSVIHILLDFCLLAVPILVLWKVQLPWSTKIRLYILFAAGALTCFAAVMRRVSQARLKSDPTYNVSALIYWTEVDIMLTVIVASMPVLGTALWSRTMNSRKTKSSNPSSGFSNFKTKSRGDVPSSHSREGIMRQDEVELEYNNPGALDLEASSGKSEHISREAYHVERQTMPWASAQRL